MWRFFCLGILCALMAPALIASMPVRMTADVPFAFEIEGRAMPAGTYELRALGQFGVMSITNANGDRAVAMLRQDGLDRLNPALLFVFERQGDRTRLTGVRIRPAETLVKPEFR